MVNNDSRTGYTVKNVSVNLVEKGLVALLKFVTRVVFVKFLGETMLGISGLFSNVLGMLALAELGIGTAINFSLYEPCASEDTEKIRSLMNAYRKAYRIISVLVFSLGLVLMPFLPHLINGQDADLIPHFYIIYLLFLFNMAIEYLFSYKRSLAIAYQKNYLFVPIMMGFEILISVLQIVSLFVLKNSEYSYISYLAVQSVSIVIENIAINRYLDKKFPILKSINGARSLEPGEKNKIIKNIKALIYHKIGGWAVTGTDNILISAMIDIITVGHYGNYSTLIVTVSGIVYLLVGNVMASFGNLIVTSSPAKRLSVFEELSFFYAFIYGVASAMFMTLFSPFITLVYGENYLISNEVVALVVFSNFYLLGITFVLDVVKGAAGLYDKDKWVPLVQAATNLIVSIVCGKIFGLFGIFIGTFVSTLVPLIAKPIIIYRYVFESSPKKYFASLLYQCLVALIISALSIFTVSKIVFANLVLQIAVNLLITGIVGISVFCIFNFRSPYFLSLFKRFKSIILRGAK